MKLLNSSIEIVERILGLLKEIVYRILFTVAVETLHVLATDAIAWISCKADAIKVVILEVR